MTSDPARRPPDRALSEAYRARASGGAAGDHPDEDAWEAFALGTMDEDARLRLADHVVSCASCREVYDAVRTLADGASAVDPGAPVAVGAVIEPGAWRRYAPVLALAAGLVLAVGAAAFYFSSSREEAERVAALAVPAVEQPRPVPPEPAPPSYRLALVKPDVQLPADLVVATRGTAGADARRFLESFGPAIAPYREGRFEEAVMSLGRFTTAHGDVPEVWFYLGVSQLFSGRPADALVSFEHPGVAAAMGDDLLWQRAVALERLGRTEELDAALRSLCGRDGAYREQACRAVDGGAGAPSRR